MFRILKILIIQFPVYAYVCVCVDVKVYANVYAYVYIIGNDLCTIIFELFLRVAQDL